MRVFAAKQGTQWARSSRASLMPTVHGNACEPALDILGSAFRGLVKDISSGYWAVYNPKSWSLKAVSSCNNSTKQELEELKHERELCLQSAGRIIGTSFS